MLLRGKSLLTKCRARGLYFQLPMEPEMQEIIASLQGLTIGALQVHRNIVLFPLLALGGAVEGKAPE